MVGKRLNRCIIMWPVGSDNYTFLPSELPNSKIIISDIARKTIIRETYNISDAYSQYDGLNSISQSKPRSEDGIHPDHHSLHALNINFSDSTFNLLSTNDGGIYLSKSSKQPGHQDMDFEYVSMGLNTTQFYGADKMPGEDRIHRWNARSRALTFNPRRRDPLMPAQRIGFALGGDGFEALWNNRNPQKIIGSQYYNGFYSSSDGGQTWRDATNGIGDDGPFLSRLASSRSYPDRIYAVGASGFINLITSVKIGICPPFNQTFGVVVTLLT